MDETKGIFKKAINAVNPGWLAFCGGIALLLFILSISFRIMDFNPGPLFEKHYEIALDSRKIDNEIKLNMTKFKNGYAEKIKRLEERIEALELLSHEPGK